MKALTNFFVACLFVAIAPRGYAGESWFAGTLEVHSVVIADGKAIFVVSGPCDVMIAPKDTGKAQVAHIQSDHTAVVFYRTNKEYPTDKAWQDMCEVFRGTVGKHVRFDADMAHSLWKGGDLTLVWTERFQAGTPKITD